MWWEPFGSDRVAMPAGRPPPVNRPPREALSNACPALDGLLDRGRQGRIYPADWGIPRNSYGHTSLSHFSTDEARLQSARILLV